MEINLVSSSEVENIVCEEVKEDEVQKIIDTYFKLFSDWLTEEKGYGLAAPQIGIKKQFYVAKIDEEYKIFFNAFYVNNNSSRKTIKEGCYSYFSGKEMVEVKRWKSIKLIHYVFKNGVLERKIDIYKDVNAFVMQHEVDHLKGMTIFMK